MRFKNCFTLKALSTPKNLYCILQSNLTWIFTTILELRNSKTRISHQVLTKNLIFPKEYTINSVSNTLICVSTPGGAFSFKKTLFFETNIVFCAKIKEFSISQFSPYIGKSLYIFQRNSSLGLVCERYIQLFDGPNPLEKNSRTIME